MQSSLQATTGQNGLSSEPRRSDDELVTRARSILRWKIRYNEVRVAARDGHVILSGHVFSKLDREVAEHTIRKMTGVVTLTNRIVTHLSADLQAALRDDTPGTQARIIVKEG